jgi:hypothetical protein
MTSPGLIQSVDEQIGQPSEPGETEIPAFSPRDRPAYRRKLRVPGLNTGGEGGIQSAGFSHVIARMGVVRNQQCLCGCERVSLVSPVALGFNHYL